MKLAWVTNADSENPQDWWDGLKIGLPKASQWFSASELADRGMIGLYLETNEPEASHPVTAGSHGLDRT